jgi:hypothetical protein
VAVLYTVVCVPADVLLIAIAELIQGAAVRAQTFGGDGLS